MQIYKKFISKFKIYFKQEPLIEINDPRPKLFAWHINDWKRDYIIRIFPDKQVIFFPFKLTKTSFNHYWKKLILDNDKNELLLWGINHPFYLEEFLNNYDIKYTYVEDGFIRSVGLGANHTLPLSLNFDSKTLYFDARKESDLEYILQNYDFQKDKNLMRRARELKKKILNLGISKYNHAKNVDLNKIYGEKIKKRILVIGQVEDDASIKFGCNRPYTNNELVRLAYNENRDAQIIYKPHPDVLFKKRKQISDPNEVKDISLIVTESMPISQALETIDHVYTITSQVGFEALMRNIKVTTIGSPFYSNWGVTDDRQSNVRRKRKLTVDEIFAGAYILYPQYFNPKTGIRIKVEDAIKILIEEKDKYEHN